jgi:hypothetical protein
MRVGAIGSDVSRATQAQAAQSRPVQPQGPSNAPQGAPKAASPAAAPRDADGDTDGDKGTRGGILDIGA